MRSNDDNSNDGDASNTKAGSSNWETRIITTTMEFEGEGEVLTFSLIPLFRQRNFEFETNEFGHGCLRFDL